MSISSGSITSRFITKIKDLRFEFLLLVIFLLAELIVNPSGNFPLNDDWSYAKSVLSLVNDHKIDLGPWPAMTLLTHLVWGSIFTSCFGFSFGILRFSTMISGFIGVLVLYRLVTRISGNKPAAFIAALTLLFNPLYFNISNTFMTDVNFNTLFLLGIYFSYDYFIRQRKWTLITLFLVSLLLVLLRQYGIILPFGFFLACFFLKEHKWQSVLLAFGMLAAVYLIFHSYESYLRTVLPANSAYKFSGDMSPVKRIFWDILFANLQSRYGMLIHHTFFYAIPFALLVLTGLIKQYRFFKIIIAFSLLFFLTYFLLKDKGYQMPNVFTGMSLGVETFYQTLKGTDDGVLHNNPSWFELIMPYVAALFISLTILAFSFSIGSFKKAISSVVKAEAVLLLLLFLGYTAMLLITESYFDRYHLPLISLCIIALAFYVPASTRIPVPVIVTLLLFFYTSVFGTKDYFTLHRKSWEAYQDLRKTENLPAGKVNAGFEVYCWNDGQYSFWWEFMNLDNFNYLIQYDQEPGFKLYKSIEFRGYFPPRRDKINIFVRETPKQ